MHEIASARNINTLQKRTTHRHAWFSTKLQNQGAPEGALEKPRPPKVQKRGICSYRRGRIGATQGILGGFLGQSWSKSGVTADSQFASTRGRGGWPRSRRNFGRFTGSHHCSVGGSSFSSKTFWPPASSMQRAAASGPRARPSAGRARRPQRCLQGPKTKLKHRDFRVANRRRDRRHQLTTHPERKGNI